METRVRKRKGSLVWLESQPEPYHVSMAAFRPDLAEGKPVNLIAGRMVTGADFTPCMAEDCLEEAIYDCDGCREAFCGLHTLHPEEMDLCDGCFSLRPGRRME